MLKEVCIQGCPLYIFPYKIRILLLVQKLKVLHPDLVQPWFVDNATGSRQGHQLSMFYEDLLLIDLVLDTFQIQ